MERIEKPWGYEEVLEKNNTYVVKRLFMKKGHQCSLQYHEKKKETVMVIEGSLEVKYNDQILKMTQGDVLTVNPKEIHRMSSVDGDCLYVECSTPELDDVVRIKDSYGREELNAQL